MNIFVLHFKPRKAARWHVDKHVVKMILETCQLLYTAHWVLCYPALTNCKSVMALSKAQKQHAIPEYMKTAPLCHASQEPGYRPCHVHHPCARWTRQSLGNYQWLVTLGQELAREYRYRFHKIHSCEAHLVWLSEHLPPTLPDSPLQSFAIAMAEEYRISDDPVECYRHYYRTGKEHLISYTIRGVPHWIQPRLPRARARPTGGIRKRPVLAGRSAPLESSASNTTESERSRGPQRGGSNSFY